MPDTDTEAQEQEKTVEKDGIYGALEAEDNSIAVSDDGYIGVSPEYRNAANPVDLPMKAEEGPEAEREEIGRAHEEHITDLSTKVNPLTGFVTDDTPPSDRVKPGEEYIEGNRAVAQAMAAEAKDRLAQREDPTKPQEDEAEQTSTSSTSETPGSSPFGS